MKKLTNYLQVNIRLTVNGAYVWLDKPHTFVQNTEKEKTGILDFDEYKTKEAFYPYLDKCTQIELFSVVFFLRSENRPKLLQTYILNPHKLKLGIREFILKR